MHHLQKLLIKRLIKDNGLNYASLAKGYDAEDNINFHIKRLIELGFVTKREAKYSITPKGVNARTRFKLLTLEEHDYKTFFVGFVCNYEDCYLIKVHSNTDATFYNLPSGKPFFGENLTDALTRLFSEETGLSIHGDDFIFDSLHLKTVKTGNNHVLFDDAFTVFSISVTEKQKSNMTLQNGIEWKSINEIRNLDNRWPEIDICILKKDWNTYNVYDVTCNYVVKKEDLKIRNYKSKIA